MKITNIQDTYKIEQELLKIIENLHCDYCLDKLGNKTGDDKISGHTTSVRWLWIAKTDLEKAFMSLRKAMRDLGIAE
jgi:hypothetical protein